MFWNRAVVLRGAAVAALLAVSVPAAAQGAPRSAGAARRAQAAQSAQRPGAAARDVDRLFDAYVALQAQDVLRLSDAQFSQFLPKLRALQQLRRRALVERRQVLASLTKLLAAGRVDEARVQEALRTLRDHDDQVAAELQKAYAGVDQALDAIQQARFRVFEDQVERRKIDLMLRARRRVPPATGAGEER